MNCRYASPRESVARRYRLRYPVCDWSPPTIVGAVVTGELLRHHPHLGAWAERVA